MESQTDKKMEHDMDTWAFLGLCLRIVSNKGLKNYQDHVNVF